MTGRLTGKRALVFGAGSSGPGFGNGKAAAVQFAREGARVACVDLSADAAQETAEIIRGEGWEAIAVAADVTELQSVSATVARACEAFGGIDILHNNVGVTHMGGPVELDEESFRASVDLNIGSVYRTSKAVLPVMLAQGGGAIVNISSLASIRWTGYPYFAYYAMKADCKSGDCGAGHAICPAGHSCQLHSSGNDRHPTDLQADQQSVCVCRRDGGGAQCGCPGGSHGRCLRYCPSRRFSRI